MWNDKWSVEGLSLLGPANFDLGKLMAESMAATVPGAGISAAGTPAGGGYATTAGQMQKTAEYAKAGEQEFEAAQTEQNAAQALASAQRTAYETRLRTGLPLETDGSPPSS
jgi:hypothetical protein